MAEGHMSRCHNSTINQDIHERQRDTEEEQKKKERKKGRKKRLSTNTMRCTLQAPQTAGIVSEDLRCTGVNPEERILKSEHQILRHCVLHS